MVIVVVADESTQIPLEIVHRTVIGPLPPVWVKVALGSVALLKFPVPPLTTLHCPVPFDGAFPPRPVVVPFTQIVCGPPTVAVVGGWLIVIVTVADEAVQGELEIVQLTMIGPPPPVWVKVAFGVVAFGLNVPVPPPTTLHIPVPLIGMFPPSPVVVPLIQIVWAPPTVAVVGGAR